MKSQAEAIQTMSVYDLSKLLKAGPTMEQRGLMDKRRQVIQDEIQKSYSRLKTKEAEHKAKVGEYVIARREERGAAANDTTGTTGKHPDLRVPRTPRKPGTPRMTIRPGLKSKAELASAMKAGLAKTGIALGTQKGLAKTAEIQKVTTKMMKELEGLGKEPTPTPSPPATPPPPSTPVGKTIAKIEPITPPKFPTGLFSREASRDPTPELAEPEEAEEAGHDPLLYSEAEEASTESGSRDSQIQSFGTDYEYSQGDDRGDEDTDEWSEDVHALLQAEVSWDVELPRRPLMGFQPSPAPINDEGNSSFFHTRFLDRGGPRDKVGITGGYMLLRPKHIEIVVERLSFATRQELSNYLHGRFPMGGVINKKSYSNTDLPLAVFRHLPGKVTITY